MSSLPDGKSRPPLGVAELASLVLPWLVSALVVARLAVPAPWRDEWDAFGRFWLEVQTHGLSFAALWAQHNEHRIVVSRLLFYLFSGATLSPVPLIYLAFAMLMASFALLFPIVESACRPLERPWRLLFYFAFAAFASSWVQWENLLWGLQVGWSVAIFGMLLAVRGLVGSSRLALAVGLALAYLSYAQWVVLIPVILGHQGHQTLRVIRRGGHAGPALLRLLGLAAALAVLLLLYLHGLRHPSHHPSRLYGLHHPGELLDYLSFFFGNIFTPLGPPSVLPISTRYGALFMLGTALALGLGYRRLDGQRSLTLWVLVAVYGIALLISIGRVGLGTLLGASSRYTTFTLIGWVVLLAAALGRFGQLRIVRLAVLAVLLCVVGIGATVGRWVADVDTPARRQGVVCLRQVLAEPASLPDRRTCLLGLASEPEAMFPVAAALHRVGWQP